MRHRLFHVSGQFSIGRESSTRRTAGKVFHCAEKDKHAKPQVRAADFEITGFFAAFRLRNGLMFQLINGTIECGECRNEILHGEEFDCEYCSASLCGNCIAQHESECITWLQIKSPHFH